MTGGDRQILRGLAGRKAEIAHDTVNTERREAWLNLDCDASPRPMVLAETGGIQDTKRPVNEAELRCEEKKARGIERALRKEIYQFDVLRDDHVVEPWIQVPRAIHASGYGVEVVRHRSPNEAGKGSCRIEPPIRDLERDLPKLSPRTFTVDRAETDRRVEKAAQLFDGILPVRIRGSQWWTMGMTWTAIDLIGLEGLMLAMYDKPEHLHRLMAFLRDDHLAFARWLDEQDLLSLNNENDYIGSGSMGYTRRLPSDGTGGVRLTDLWVLLESQETVGVGPDLFAEFIYPYQKSIAEAFGSVYYGCCEPVHTRWRVLKGLPNLERVSISPWCDERFMAEALGRRYVYSRKPKPTMVSTDNFDEDAIRSDIRNTLDTARDCRLEIIMKDVHTLREQPERLARWVEITREEIGT